jgi:hypothetical protein
MRLFVTVFPKENDLPVMSAPRRAESVAVKTVRYLNF